MIHAKTMEDTVRQFRLSQLTMFDRIVHVRKAMLDYRMVHVYRLTILAVLTCINHPKVKLHLRLKGKESIAFENLTENCSERGEVFGTRGGCDFIADCEHPDPPAPPPPGETRICPMFVMETCFCPSGLLRNSLGECVERRFC